jgi:rod shape determining protein RodA
MAIRGNISAFAIILFLCGLALSVISIVLIYSATNTAVGGPDSTLYIKQMIWVMISLLLFFVVLILPLRMHEVLSYVYYAILLLLLVALMFYGRSGGGSQRWFNLGFFHFQPSELGKVVVLFVLARYLSYAKPSQHIKRLFSTGILVLIPTALILRQPDLGTSLVYLMVMLVVLFVSGLPSVYLLLITAPIFCMITAFHPISLVVFFMILIAFLIALRPGAAMASLIVFINLVFGIITPIFWSRLAKYQQDRILVFLDPSNDKLGAGYQIIQSKIAIGSGGLFGKGFLAGTQTNLNYLPVRHTDFIYSVMGEEFGFIGGIIIILLMSVIIILGLRTALRTRNKFASYVCVGAVTILFFQTLVNIGMTLGMMPVTGLPLHFVSYGGSSMILSWILLGLLVNAELNWQEY